MTAMNLTPLRSRFAARLGLLPHGAHLVFTLGAGCGCAQRQPVPAAPGARTLRRGGPRRRGLSMRTRSDGVRAGFAAAVEQPVVQVGRRLPPDVAELGRPVADGRASAAG